MEKINTNGQIIGGAAETTSIIITKNGAIFHFATPTSAFFEFRDMELTNELCYREVLNYLKKYATNGIDLIVNGENIGYIKYSTFMPMGLGVGIDICLIDGENTEVHSSPSGMKKWCENARNNMAADLKDYIEGLIDDAEWEQIMDESEFIGNETALLESAIDDANSDITKTIDETKDIIDDIVDVDWWELDEEALKNQIAENCSHISFALNELAQARENFLKRISDYTGCDFGFGDAYSDEPVVDIYPYYAEISDFDCTQAFEDILAYLFDTPSQKYGENSGTCETLLSLRDTLFHYLMVA